MSTRVCHVRGKYGTTSIGLTGRRHRARPRQLSIYSAYTLYLHLFKHLSHIGIRFKRSGWNQVQVPYLKLTKSIGAPWVFGIFFQNMCTFFLECPVYNAINFFWDYMLKKIIIQCKKIFKTKCTKNFKKAKMEICLSFFNTRPDNFWQCRKLMIKFYTYYLLLSLKISIDFFIQNTVYDPLNRIPLCKYHIYAYMGFGPKNMCG